MYNLESTAPASYPATLSCLLGFLDRPEIGLQFIGPLELAALVVNSHIREHFFQERLQETRCGKRHENFQDKRSKVWRIVSMRKQLPSPQRIILESAVCSKQK
jgi:hypothetical protein